MICSKCKKEKDIKYFSWRTDTKKYRTQCKMCHKGYRGLREDLKQRISEGKKHCGKCKMVKTLDNFHKDNGMSHGYTSRCKQCIRKYQKLNKAMILETRLMHLYGVERDTARTLLEITNCEICGCEFGDSIKSAVDHCHETGEVRGVLCRQCNIGLGHFRDNPEILEAAIKYIRVNNPLTL